MNGKVGLRRVRTVAGLVIAVLAVAAVALGQIPDQNGVIRACYSKSGGALRVTDGACKSGETSLSWNQKGPVGPAGPQGAPGVTGEPGAQGAQGAQGPSGISRAFSARQAESQVFFQADDVFHDIVGVELPPGRYVVTATGNVFAGDPTAAAGNCSLRLTPSIDSTAYDRSFFDLDNDFDWGLVALSATIDTSSAQLPRTLVVTCLSATGIVGASQFDLNAIAVDQLN